MSERAVAIAQALLVMGTGFLVGVLGSGIVADRLTRRGMSLLDVNLGFLAIYFAAQVAIIFHPPGSALLAWSIFAMTGQSAVLAYPWLSSYFGADLPMLPDRSYTSPKPRPYDLTDVTERIPSPGAVLEPLRRPPDESPVPQDTFEP